MACVYGQTHTQCSTPAPPPPPTWTPPLPPHPTPPHPTPPHPTPPPPPTLDRTTLFFQGQPLPGPCFCAVLLCCAVLSFAFGLCFAVLLCIAFCCVFVLMLGALLCALLCAVLGFKVHQPETSFENLNRAPNLSGPKLQKTSSC